MELVTKIIVNSLPFFVAILLAVLDYYKTDKRTTIFKNLRKSLIGLLVMSLFVSLYFTISSHYTEKEIAATNLRYSKTIDSLMRVNYAISLLNSDKIDSSLSHLNIVIDDSKTMIGKLNNEGNRISDLLVHSQKLLYPLPKAANLSLTLSFKFDKNITHILDSIISTRYDLNKHIVISGLEVNPQFLQDVVNWDDFFQNLDVHFAKDFHSGMGINSILSLSNYPKEDGQIGYLGLFDKSNGANVKLIYYPRSKSFAISYNDIELIALSKNKLSQHNNFGERSIIDLQNSTFMLKLYLPKYIEEQEIESLNFESNELTFLDVRLEKTRVGSFHYFDIEKL